MRNEILLKKFLTHIDLERGYSINTVKTYKFVIQNFFLFLEKNKVKLNKVKKEHIEKYILYLRNGKKNCAKSIRLKIKVLKSFFKYLTEILKIYRVTPIDEDDFKYKVEKKEVKSISENQIEILLKILEREKVKTSEKIKTTTGKKILLQKKLFAINRDNVLLKLFLSSGVRVSEILNIKLQDIDFVDKSIIINGKGGKFRTIFFDLEEFEKDFLKYIDSVKSLNIKTDYIFLNIKDYFKLTPRAVQLMLKKYIKLSGLTENITPHVLRHTFASVTIEKGANIKAVSQILGHSNVQITINTYTHLSNEHVREVMKMCNPLSNTVIPLKKRVENRMRSLIYLKKTG